MTDLGVVSCSLHLRVVALLLWSVALAALGVLLARHLARLFPFVSRPSVSRPRRQNAYNALKSMGNILTRVTKDSLNGAGRSCCQPRA